LIESPKSISGLRTRSEEEQDRAGYKHTLREILQQPATITATCEGMLASSEQLKKICRTVHGVVLTGSGSSEYVGHCVSFALQQNLRIPVETIATGALLTHGKKALPPTRPLLMVSMARSGDSPESASSLLRMLEADPGVSHVVITCNANGKLASQFRDDKRVIVISLDERTNDRSLVMTSSFTAMAIAARGLGLLDAPDKYRTIARHTSATIKGLLEHSGDALLSAGQLGFNRAVYLASAPRHGSAREAGLKMLEMTAGRVATLAETYLGLRHGPMSFLDKQTLAVCFLSSNPVTRAYEADVMRELDRKNLGLCKVILGEDIPADLKRPGDVVAECKGLSNLGDEDGAIVDVVVAQLLAFGRCLKEGLRPDSPSEKGIINRVVNDFELH
jgi:tagatose-6-phosphate ketose/aldose isomerase